MVSDGASAWGSTKMGPAGTTNLGDSAARGLGAEATGGIAGLEAKVGGMRARAPQLPPPRQDIPGAGVVTPPRKKY